MTGRSIGTTLVMVLLLSQAAPAWAQQAKCLAGKTGCMAKKAAGFLKCEALAETPGKPADPNAKDCLSKAQTKFDGGLAPAKGCFEKLESKNPNDCPTVDNTGAASMTVDACVAALLTAIDPPPLDQTKCGAGKKKCASKYLAALLKCRRQSQTPGKPADPNTKGCVDKAVAKYTGGPDPTKGCFAKLEAKDPNDCQSTTDSATVKALAEECVDDFVAVVMTTTTTTTTSTTTTTRPYTLVQSYTNQCIPYNYLNLFSNLSFASYDAAYAYCVGRCDATAGCVKIWVAHDCDGVGSTPSWCLTSAVDTGSNFDKGWTSNEIQCSYPPIPACANWYNLVVP